MERPAAEFGPVVDRPSRPISPTRRDHRAQLRAEIADWTRQHATSEILDRLDGRVPTVPLQDTSDVFADPHVHAREMLTEVSQPGADERMTVADSPIKMTETDPEPRGRAPLLDEHRAELLGERRIDSDSGRAESDD